MIKYRVTKLKHNMPLQQGESIETMKRTMFTGNVDYKVRTGVTHLCSFPQSSVRNSIRLKKLKVRNTTFFYNIYSIYKELDSGGNG